MDEAAVLAALSAFSGLPHGTRLLFAAQGEIEHYLALTPQAADSVTASLRAAIPSLRLDHTPPPRSPHTRQLLWQLAPAKAAIRSDEPATVAASLLASLYPLQPD